MLKKLIRPIANRLYASLERNVKDELRRAGREEMLKRFFSVAPDLETLTKIVSSQRFRSMPLPQSRSAPDGERLLIYAPHQDDETLGLGGTLLRSAQRGKQIKIVYVTDGAARTSAANDETLIEVREQEARLIWDDTGVEPLVFMRQPCRKLTSDDATAREIREQISAFQPNCIFLPSLFESPEDHRATAALLIKADELEPIPDDIEIWSYQVTGMLAPNVVIDITELMDQKYEMNIKWASQMSFFNWAHSNRGLNAYNAIYLPKAPSTGPSGATSKRPVELFAELFHVLPMKEYRSFASPLLDSVLR
jgi:LmbE family N-acetylglucosaminyl deacetylase